MSDYETLYKRNRSVFPSESAKQLTVMGSHKQHRDIITVPEEKESEIHGLVAKRKLAGNYSV